MKYYYPEKGIETLSRLFGKTRQGYYHMLHQRNSNVMEEAIIIKLVEEYREHVPEGVGAVKLTGTLKSPLSEHGIKIGRDKMFALLGRHGMLLRKRKRKVITTNSRHSFRVYPNLITDIQAERAEQIWVSDITYLKLSKGFCYLSLVTDAYSRKIVGYALKETLESQGPVSALLMALSTRTNSDLSLIHHSDRGIQYCSNAYVKLLESHNIRISMTQKGSPYENAQAERINGILKTEFRLNKTFASLEEAERTVAKSIAAYNNIRPHASHKNNTPQKVHTENIEMWKTFKS